MMEETTIKKGEEAVEILKPEINTDPEITTKHEVGDKLAAYWVDTVIDSMPYEWFQIKMEGNRIVIEPVRIETITN